MIVHMFLAFQHRATADPLFDQVPWDIGREQPLVAEAVEKGLFKSPVRAFVVVPLVQHCFECSE